MKGIIFDPPATYSFTRNLKTHLRTMCKDKVQIIVTEDGDLIIRFEESENTYYSYMTYDIQLQIMYGLTSKDLATVAVKRYRDHILRKHFNTVKRENGGC